MRKHSCALPYRRAALIYNPSAGGLRNGNTEQLEQAMKMFRAAGSELNAYATAGPRDATSLARYAIHSGADLVIAAGGDGTISEVVDGLAGSGVPLAVLPAGTANVLAHEVGIPLNVVQAARRLSGYVPARIALGRIDSDFASARAFLMMAGAGFDADIVFHLGPGLKQKLGRFSYWLAGLARLPRKLEQLTATVDGVDYDCSFALVSRVRNYGGDFAIARKANLGEDDFEVVLLEAEQGLTYLRHLAGVVTQQLHRFPGVRFLRAQEVELRPANQEPVHLQADGEYMGLLPTRISLLPGALTLLTPPAYLEARNHRRAASV